MLHSAVDTAILSVVCDVGASYLQSWIFFCNIFAPHCSLAIWLICEENSAKIYANVFPREWYSTVYQQIRHIIGHFGDYSLGQMTQPAIP